MMRKQLAVGLCAMAVSASAATVTWTGAAGDNLWWTDGNWDSGVTPGATSADDIVIPAGDVVYATAGDLNPSGTVTLGTMDGANVTGAVRVRSATATARSSTSWRAVRSFTAMW